MDLVSYDSFFHVSLTSFYNTLIAGVPHCYPVAPDELGTALVTRAKHCNRHRSSSQPTQEKSAALSTAPYKPSTSIILSQRALS